MRRPSIPPFDTYREYFTKNWLEWFDSLDNEIKQTRLLLHSYIAHASLAHNDLTGIQGGTTNEYYHLTSAELADVVNISGHIADTTIHFTDASILHNNRTDLQGGAVGEYYHLDSADNTEAVAFLDGGSTTHTAVDTHIANLEIHGIEYDERDMTYTAGLLTKIIYKLATVTVETMTITYDTSDRPLQYSYSVSGKVVDLVHLGTGFLSEAV